jgi:ATP-dependent helicase/nuclease subunit B
LAPRALVAYNAGMGATKAVPGPISEPEHEIADWLRNGGLVVAASERAARALTARYHRARRAEGLAAWPAPDILDWQSFLRRAWRDRANSGTADDRLLLDPLQEQSIWSKIAGSELHMATLLEGPLNRMAALAMDAHRLLCSYAPEFLRATARTGWQQDAGDFSAWLTTFEETCRTADALSPARLPLELIQSLERESPDAVQRPRLLLAGFDRVLPIQRRLFDSWGPWQEVSASIPASYLRFYQAVDTQSELIACALWCKQKLADNPRSNLLVITQDISQRRGEIERAFLNYSRSENDASSPLFEFSLGIPLGHAPFARGAHLLLRWLSNPLAEHELDWLLSSSQLATDAQESITVQAYMRALRGRGLERPQWTLNAFLAQPPNSSLPPMWVARIRNAQHRLAEHSRLDKSPLEWAELVPQLLQASGWPGARPLSSAEFQTLRRWEQCVESCASLGFDGRRISWLKFLSVLERALDETLFAPESREAPIQIAGPAESAGLTADAIWFMGATEDAWPASGATHPLLPLEIQRDFVMPHATSQLDWELSKAITTRLLSSAPEIRFSYAQQNEDVESRPSHLITHFTNKPQPLPVKLLAPKPQAPLLIFIEDSLSPSFPSGPVAGGSRILTFQSQCPFKAFAVSRLSAEGWQPAEAGLTAAQRGQLLHAVLHAVWAGGPLGIRTLADLRALPDRKGFLAGHVNLAVQQSLRPSIRERMPKRYLELEELRLVRLVNEWLDYEATRLDFEVLETEAKRTIHVEGLTFDLRLDRVDRLSDGTLLVIDYKTGQVTTKSWEPPRPEDVQLPLYAGFALAPSEQLGGLAFAKVRSGEQSFSGHVLDARASLIPCLSGTSSLVRNPLTVEQLIDWKKQIESLANDFLAGRAIVDPREYPKTCEHCGLETLCRVQETRATFDEEDEEADDE